MGTLLRGLLYLVGIFFIVTGALTVFATDMTRKKFFAKILATKDMKKWAPASIVIGIVLLLSASLNRYPLFIVLLGLLSIIKGAVIIAAPEKMEKIKSWWEKANDNAYRIWGVAVIIIGSIVLMGI